MVTTIHELFVSLLGTNGGTSTAIDTLGTSFTCVNLTGTTMDDVYCYGKTTTSGTNEITVTTSFNFSGAVIAIEIQGLASFALDGTPTTLAIASSNSWTLASLITTNANDIIIGCGGNESTEQHIYGWQWICDSGQRTSQWK